MESSLREAAREAFVYALPMTEIATTRSALLGAGIPAGQFHMQRGLATPDERWVTTPNVDTIYANSFIDLTHGPATLTLPAFGERYGSVALMDMFSDNIAVVGTRTTGQDGGTFTLVGPNHAAPAGAIRSPTPWLWALARVLVQGPSDVPAALEVLHAIRCEPTRGPTTAAPGADRKGDRAAWLKAANALLLENAPPATDRRVLQRIAPLGLGSADFDPSRFSEAEMAEIAAGFEDGRQAVTKIAGFGGKRVGSWLYPATNTGFFFQDYLTRAAIAVGGLAALPTCEAMYLAALAPDGGLFDGEGPWRLRFAADQLPPVDGFWSVTMYQAEQGGAFFLTKNPIDRYTVGDRTAGLRYDADGALEITIARSDPGAERSANWLPAPARGPFVMILRTYLPRRQLIAQDYTPPSVERI